jgi:hypothetical protein
MMRAIREWRLARRIEDLESPAAAERVERLLREQAVAERAAPSARLRGRILEATCEAPAIQVERGAGGRSSFRVLVPVAVAAAAALMWMVVGPWRAPAPRDSGLPVAWNAEPMLRLVSGSIDRPLLREATHIVDDTKRATRFVVQCLPLRNLDTR